MAFSIDDGWDNCGPVAQAGNAAFGVYCRLGAWVARNISSQAITDPVVPFAVAAALCSPELAAKLVDAGLWEAVDGGWFMPHYLSRNESASQVSARRKRDAARKAKYRASRVDKTRDSQGSPGGTPRRVRSSFTPPKGGRDAPPSDALPKPHPFADDGTGQHCTRCVLPRINKIHRKVPA